MSKPTTESIKMLLDEVFSPSGVPASALPSTKRRLRKVLKANSVQYETIRGVGFVIPAIQSLFTYSLKNGIYTLARTKLSNEEMMALPTRRPSVKSKALKKPKAQKLSDEGWATQLLESMGLDPTLTPEDMDQPLTVFLLLAPFRKEYPELEAAEAQLTTVYPHLTWVLQFVNPELLVLCGFGESD